MASLRILGSRIDPLTSEETIQTIERFLSDGGPHHVITGNTLMLLAAEEDASLRKILDDASLVVPESSGILWASRRLGVPLAEFTPGIDLMLEICRMAAEKGHPAYFLGSSPGVAESAAKELSSRFPGLQVSGTHDGFFAKDEEPRIIERIKKTKPAILFVGMGMPAQEKWIARYLSELSVPVVMGVGGSFDVISGKLKRAPALFRRAGMEWAYRLVQEPWRWRRITQLPVFAWKVLRQRAARLSLLALLCLAMPLPAVMQPRALGYITDAANVMDPTIRERLESRLRDFEQNTSIEVVLVTIPSLEGQPVEDYSVKLFKSWGIGKKGKDNGVLVLMALKERQVRIEVGYGLEPILTDGLCGEIIKEDMIPHFRSGDYGRGLSSGLDTILKILLGNAPPSNASQRKNNSVGFLIYFLLVLMVLLPYTSLSLLLIVAATALLKNPPIGAKMAVFALVPIGLGLDIRRWARKTGAGNSSYYGVSGSRMGGGWGGGFGGGTSFGGFGGGFSSGGGASAKW